MVKLLGIVGSPRKGGNTEIIVREALKAAEEEGASTELMFLTDFGLGPCDGCRTCFDTKDCVLEDDVEKIYGKIAKADGIIIGSPVYFNNVTAQTKTFIDRIGYLNIARGRKALRNKVGGAIVVARRAGLSYAYDQILMFFSGMRMITANPAVGLLANAKGEVMKDAEGVEAARELGRSMVHIAEVTGPLRKNIVK